MNPGGIKDIIVRRAVRLLESAEKLKDELHKSNSFTQRVFLVVRLSVVLISVSVLYSIVIIFFSGSSSFTFLHSLDDQKSTYTASYTQHRSWQRRVRLTAGSSMTVLLALSMTIVVNFIVKGDLDVFAADYGVSCTGTAGSPTAITESTYGASDTLTLSDGGGDGYCELDNSLTVGTLTVNTGVVLTHVAQDTDGVTVTATNVTVASGASIDVSEKGYAGGDSSQNGGGTGGGIGSDGFNNNGGGGGAYGGDGGSTTNHAGGTSYGDADAPAALGSGGGRGRVYCGAYTTAPAGDGGGFVSLTASGTVTIDGTISVNGGDGQEGCSENNLGGGGSGGGVYISAATFAGGGTITSDGGSAYTDGRIENGGGGGGGRIYVAYSSTATFSGSFSAAGGQGYENGDAGTAAIYDSSTDDITIYDGFDFSTDDSPLTYNDLTVSDNSSRIRFYGASASLSLSVANLVSPASSTWICMDSSTDITLAASSALDLDGITWTACNDVTITRTSNAALTVTGFSLTSATGDIALDISDELTLDGSTITTSTRQTALTLTAATSLSLVDSDISANIESFTTNNLTIDADSTLTANALGQSGGYGGGGSTKNGYGDGGGIGSDGFNNNGGGGGAYGGAGGSTTNHAGGSTYGSETNPTDYGSGGGRGRVYCAAYTTAPGGHGGGKIILTVNNTLDLDGTISVNGGDGQEGCSENNLGGAGSGGSVNITTTIFSGTGTITSDGGSAYTDGRIENGGGGGGGRIHYGYVTGADWSGTIQASGGTGYDDGEDGTIDALALTVASQPTISSPTASTYNNSVNLTLTGSSYTSNGASHSSSTWTIYSDVGGETIVWQASNDASNLESIVVNSSNGTFQGALDGETALGSNTTYYASVHYTNAIGNSTAASLVTFTTEFTGTTTTTTWDFTESADYTIDTDYIEFSAGVAQLLDQGSSTYGAEGVEGRTKRKEISITGTGSELTNYQIELSVAYDSDMQTDFDDLYFTASDGSTEVNHWLESIDDNGTGGDASDDTATVWVKVPTIAASGTTTLYMYYADDDAVSSSSATDVLTNGGVNATFYSHSGTSPADFAGMATFFSSTVTGVQGRDVISNINCSSSCNTQGGQDSYAFFGYAWIYAPSDGTYTFGTNSDDGSDFIIGADNFSATDPGGDLVVDYYGAHAAGGFQTDTIALTTGYHRIVYRMIEQSGGEVAIAGWQKPGDGSVAAIPSGSYYYTQYQASVPSASFGSETTVGDSSVLTVVPSEGGDHPVYDTLFRLEETRPEGSPGDVYYQISNDGESWYYYNGAEWTAASDLGAHRNAISTVNNYLPAFVDDVGTGSFYYRAFLIGDGTQQVSMSNLELTFNANPSTSTISTQTLTEDTDVTGKFDLDDYFTDAGDTLSYSVLDGFDAALGTMTVNEDGTVDFDLADNANGSDTIQFRATDQLGITADSNSVTVTVTAVNDAPTTSISASSTTPNEDDSTVTLNANAADAENDTLSYTWAETLDASDACSLNDSSSATPTVSIANKDSNYTCAYRVTVNDGNASTQETVTMNVTADNDAPTIATISDKSVNEGDQLQFATSASDVDTSTVDLSIADPESDFSAQNVTVSELFSDNNDNTGTFTWTPESDQSGSYVARVDASDSNSTTTQLFNITVADTLSEDTGGDEDSGNTGPTFGNRNLPNVSFAAGVETVVLFDLDEYFTDADEDTLSYTATDLKKINVTITDGEVRMSTPASFAGTRAITFTAEDPSGETAVSNPIVVTVTETIPRDDINTVTGKSKKKGKITIRDSSGDVIASWQAFKKGGVVPRLATVQDNTFVLAIKRRAGSTVHAYTSQGTILKKQRLSPKLHYRKLAIGNLDSNDNTVELVVATRRGSVVYFKVFSFHPEKKRFRLQKRSLYKGIKKNTYQVEIQKKRIKLINEQGQTKFLWKPFE